MREAGVPFSRPVSLDARRWMTAKSNFQSDDTPNDVHFRYALD